MAKSHVYNNYVRSASKNSQSPLNSVFLTVQTGFWITVLTHATGKPAYATIELEEEPEQKPQQPAPEPHSLAPAPSRVSSSVPEVSVEASFAAESQPSQTSGPPPVSAAASAPEVVPVTSNSQPEVPAQNSSQKNSPVPQVSSSPELSTPESKAKFGPTSLSLPPGVGLSTKQQSKDQPTEGSPAHKSVSTRESATATPVPGDALSASPENSISQMGQDSVIESSVEAPQEGTPTSGVEPTASPHRSNAQSEQATTQTSSGTTSPLDTGYSTEARDLLLHPPAVSSGAEGNHPAFAEVNQSADSPSVNEDAGQGEQDQNSRAATPGFESLPEDISNGEEENANQNPSSEVSTPKDPVVIPPGVLDPLATTIPFNSDVLEYDNQATLASGVNFGDDRSTNLRYAGSVDLSPRVESHTTADNIAVLEQRQGVVFFQDTLQERRLSISLGDPITFLGQDIQLSLTGSCLDPAVGEICTFTPGLATDNDSIDPVTQLPTRFEQYSNFGDVVDPATLEAIQAPGFQRGTEEQQIGLDLRFPQIAVLPGNSQATDTEILRDEQFVTTPAVGYATVSQVVQANANEAVIARTIRGPAVVFDADQPVTNILLAALALALPEVRGTLTPTEAPANPNVNLSLFNAANNIRLPLDSLTLYHAGSGYAATPSESLESSRDRPPARFNGVWLGLSPVTERSYEERFEVVPIGDRVQTLAAGGEGGGGDTAEVIALVDGEQFGVNTIDNIYTQNYVNLYEQDAFRLYTFEQTDRIHYYPHLSFSGNITRAYDTLRYYVGTIAGETIQAYGGVDYQAHTDDGWYYQVGGIGFLNPNYDRYSNLSGGLAKQFAFNDNQNLTLGASFNWALDQDTSLGDIEQTGEGSDITLQARLNLGQVSLGATQVLGDILPNSQATRTVLDTAVRLGENVTLAGFWAPFDNATSAPVVGLTADIDFDIGDVNPGLIVSWENSRYNYGEGPDGSELTTTGDVFEVLLRMRW